MSYEWSQHDAIYAFDSLGRNLKDGLPAHVRDAINGLDELERRGALAMLKSASPASLRMLYVQSKTAADVLEAAMREAPALLERMRGLAASLESSVPDERRGR